MAGVVRRTRGPRAARLPVVEQVLDVVERVRAIRVARELHLLPGRELGEELAREPRRLLLEAPQLGLERDGRSARARAARLTRVTSSTTGFSKGRTYSERHSTSVRTFLPRDLRLAALGFSRFTLKMRMRLLLALQVGRAELLDLEAAAAARRASPR